MDEEKTLEDIIVEEMLKLIGDIDKTEAGSEERHKAVKDAKVFMDDLNNRAKIEIDDDRLERELELREKELEIKLKQVELEEEKIKHEKESSKWKVVGDIAIGAAKIGTEAGISLLALALMKRNFDIGLRFEDEGIFSSVMARENRSSMNNFLKNRIG